MHNPFALHSVGFDDLIVIRNAYESLDRLSATSSTKLVAFVQSIIPVRYVRRPSQSVGRPWTRKRRWNEQTHACVAPQPLLGL